MEKSLYIFVEGTDDDLFFQKIVKPLFIKYHGYTDVNIIITPYSKTIPEQKVLIRTVIKQQPERDYIIICDFDRNNKSKNPHNCFNGRKAVLQKEFGKILAPTKIFIVENMIESWYYAIIKDLRKFGLPYLSETSKIDNELPMNHFNFDAKIPLGYERVDFLQEIIKDYSEKLCKTKATNCNFSFKYFIEKHGLDKKLKT